MKDLNLTRVLLLAAAVTAVLALFKLAEVGMPHRWSWAAVTSPLWGMLLLAFTADAAWNLYRLANIRGGR